MFYHMKKRKITNHNINVQNKDTLQEIGEQLHTQDVGQSRGQ